MQIPLPFEDPGPKTLKWKLKKGYTAEDGVIHAKAYLAQSDYHTRIEFKSGDYYFVVAKLKDKDATD